MARLMNKFQPILIEIRRLEEEIEFLEDEVDRLQKNIIKIHKDTISIDKDLIIDKKEDLEEATDSESIIKNKEITSILNNIRSDDAGRIYQENEFRYHLNNELDRANFSNLKSQLSNYSSVVSVNKTSERNILKIIQKPILKFKLEFPAIEYVPTQEDVYNKDTGERTIKDILFPIKSNKFYNPHFPSLPKNKSKNILNVFKNFTDEDPTYFNSLPGLNIITSKYSDWDPTGTIYDGYYNKLEDPTNNLFSKYERGLTSDVFEIDPILIDTELTKKKEGSFNYFIRDQKKMENFYIDFENNLENRKVEIRNSIIKPAKNRVSSYLKSLAKIDIKLLLALGRINIDIVDESSKLNGIIKSIEIENVNYLSALTNLTRHIKIIKKKLEKLKPTPEKVKARLVKLDPNCFEKELDDTSDEELKSKVKDAMGNDPFGEESLKKTDPTLPTALDFKYWIEFSKTLNKVNLLPFIDLIPTQLRYWPIGFFIITPIKIVKIPLPIIWIPIISIPSPFGTVVIFITINGVFISPIVFFIAATGFKQHILTIKGPTNQFGYDGKEIKPSIALPLSALSAKDAAKNLNQNPLDKLNSNEKAKHNLKIKKLKANLKTKDPNSASYKKLNEKINNLNESVSLDSQSQKAQVAIDKKESAIDAINIAKESFKDRMDDLGQPEFKKSNDIKLKIQSDREKLKKEIDDTYISDLNITDKRKKLKKLRGEYASEQVSISDKKKAIKDDTLDFYNKIKFPTISVPADSGMLNPVVNPIDISEKETNFQLSNLKNDPTAEKNKSIMDSVKREITIILDIVNTDDIPTDSTGKINVKENIEAIKNKLLEIKDKIINKLKGKSTINIDNYISQKESLEKNILTEKDEKVKLQMISSLKKIDLEISNHNETMIISETNTITPDKVSELASSKFEFDAFKSLTSLLPKVIPISNPLPDTVLPIETANTVLTTYINNLDSKSLTSLMGGQENITPATIKELFFNISNSNIPADLKVENKMEASSIFDVSSGLLSSLSIPFQSIPVYEPSSLEKPIDVNLNMLKAPIRKKLDDDMDNYIDCLPTDIKTNFNDLNSNDIKAQLTISVLDKLDKVINVLEPIFIILNILKSGNGTNLDPIQYVQHKLKPPGAVIQAIFNAKALLKSSIPKSATMMTIDNIALENARKLLSSSVSPVMDVPASFIIPSAAASIGLSDVQRLFHPILNSDDIPPWERLSSKNFLHILFLDEFITEAADKIGFYRKFI